jgi:hypothetical protein
MGGRGPQPKNDAQRARQNKTMASRVIEMPAGSVDHSVLPDDLLPEGDYWHAATVRWWKRWAESPLAAHLPEVDWSELEATAILHHEFMQKRSFTLASELRLRMQKFGATPEDRQRLRILVAEADSKDGRPEPSSSGSGVKGRFGPLKAV